VTWSVQETLHRMIIASLKWTLLIVVVIGKDKTKWGAVESSTHIRRRWRSLTKLHGVISQAKKSTTPFHVTLDNIVQHTNQYILIIQQNFTRESDPKLRHIIQIKGFMCVLRLAGALRSNKQSVEEPWGPDGDGVE
jgi:hypothetical protein